MADKSQKTDWSRQTVNFDPDVAIKAEARWRALGLASWTQYITKLVESDLRDKPLLILSDDGAAFAAVIRQLDRSAIKDADIQFALDALKEKKSRHPVRQKQETAKT